VVPDLRKCFLISRNDNGPSFLNNDIKFSFVSSVPTLIFLRGGVSNSPGNVERFPRIELTILSN